MSITTGQTGKIQIINVSTPFTLEDTTEDGATMIYTIDDSGLIPWDPNYPITVSTGSLDTSWMDEGVDWFTGRVKMTSAGLTGLTVNGSSATLQTVGYVSGFSFATTGDTGEITSVGETYKSYTGLGKGATISLNRYRFDTLFDQLDDFDWILMKMYVDATNGFWAKTLKGNMAITKGINAVDTDATSFTVSSAFSEFS